MLDEQISKKNIRVEVKQSAVLSGVVFTPLKI